MAARLLALSTTFFTTASLVASQLSASSTCLAAASSYSYADCLAAVTAVRLAASTAAGTANTCPRARKTRAVSFASGRTCELQYQHEGTGEVLGLVVEADSLPRGLPRPASGKGGLTSARLLLAHDEFNAVKSELVRIGLQRLQRKRKRDALGDEAGRDHCKRSRPRPSRAAELSRLEDDLVKDGLLEASALPHFSA